MKLLVTGGAGFMGSNFIRYILTKYPDYEVVNFDKLTYAGNLENLRDIEQDKRYTFIQGDIADKRAVEQALEEHRPAAILNYAAETHVDRSILDPDAFIRTEVLGTYTLLEAARTHPVQRFVQVSTDEVYGHVETGRVAENAMLAPRSPYAASKAGADLLVQAFHVTYHVPAILTRACNCYGPYQFPEKFIPFFITNLIEGKPLPVYGDGKQVREWIYVDDHCAAIDLLLHQGTVGGIYNVGTEDHQENLAVVKLLLEAFGKDESVIEHVTDRPGHDRRYALDVAKLRRELHWKPTVAFTEGLRRTVEWYREREGWWRPLKSGVHLQYFQQQYGKR